jgi:hypothetical protein
VDLNDVKKDVKLLQKDVQELRDYMRTFKDEALAPFTVIIMIERLNKNMLTLIQYLMEANGHYTEEEMEPKRATGV